MRTLTMCLGATLALPLCVPVCEADENIQEVVVTAQKRAQNLQDVPAAVTALSGDSLQELHLQGTADLAPRVPSLAYDVLAPGEATLTIRGLGTAYGLEPTVSYYVNETPLDVRTDGYTGAPDIDFFDVARVEVLRGPQGTLYGSSSMGGALRVLTNQPSFDSFGVTAEAGGSVMDQGGGGYSAKSAINLPVSADFAVRLVGTYEHVPGFIDRVLPGNYNDPHPRDPILARNVNDADLTGARLIATWKPADGLTVTPTVMYSNVQAGDKSQYFTNLPVFQTAAYYPSPQQTRMVVGNLAITYDLPFASLLSSTSVLSHDVNTKGDFTLFFANLAPVFGLTYPPNTPGLDQVLSNNNGTVQEFRLTSSADQRLKWIAGAYFSRFRQHTDEYTNSAAFADALGQTNSPNLYSFDQDVSDQQVAGFADLTYQILPTLEFTVGDRYYELRDSLENVQSGDLAAPSQPLLHAKASGNSPRVVLSYHPEPNTTLYASVSRGYRPGGPNVGLPTGIGCTLVNAYSPLYSPDSVWNYELGAKGEFFDRTVTLDAAVYRIDWRNVQQAVIDPGCGFEFVANVGSARSNGAELELTYKPLPALVLSLSGSYTDATFESIDGPFQGAATVGPGSDVPDVPRDKWALAADYTRPVGSTVGFLHLDWTHLGTVPTGFTFSAERPAYSAGNAELGIRRDHYEVSLYAHNLTNSVGILSIQQGTYANFGSVFRTQIATPPRTVGVDLTVRY